MPSVNRDNWPDRQALLLATIANPENRETTRRPSPRTASQRGHGLMCSACPSARRAASWGPSMAPWIDGGVCPGSVVVTTLDDFARIRLSAQIALAGTVSPNVPAIYLTTTKPEIVLLAVFDGEILDNQREDLEVSVTEMLAQDPDWPVSVDCVRVDVPQPCNRLPGITWTLYARSEDIREAEMDTTTVRKSVDLAGGEIYEVAWRGDATFRIIRKKGPGDGLYEATLGGPLEVGGGGFRCLLPRSQFSMAWLTPLLRQPVTRFEERQDGTAVLRLADGREVRSPALPEGENWEFCGPDHLLMTAPFRPGKRTP